MVGSSFIIRKGLLSMLLVNQTVPPLDKLVCTTVAKSWDCTDYRLDFSGEGDFLFSDSWNLEPARSLFSALRHDHGRELAYRKKALRFRTSFNRRLLRRVEGFSVRVYFNGYSNKFNGNLHRTKTQENKARFCRGIFLRKLCYAGFEWNI